MTTPWPFAETELMGSIAERFGCMASWQPQHKAIVAADAELTYGALDRASAHVMQAIVQRNLPQTGPIAVLLPQGAQALVAILGCLKAGHSFAVLSPDFPTPRLRAICADAGGPLLLTNGQHWQAALAASSTPEQCLNIEQIASGEKSPPQPGGRGADDLAALFYTSGTTGEPKGVMWSQRLVLHTARQNQALYALGPQDRLAVLTSFGFGAAMTMSFAALLNGATLLLGKERWLDLDALMAWLHAHTPTVLGLPPVGLLRQIIDRSSSGTPVNATPLPNLRLVLLGGQPLRRQEADRFRTSLGEKVDIRYRLAGSETMLMAEFSLCSGQAYASDSVPVGTPVPDKEILLLDEERHPVRAGETGEIAVRSHYLANGYWRQPALTAATFLPAMHGGDAPICLTGDMGRFTPDGLLLHLGRKDNMVKIRGYRVQLEAVESALSALEHVREAVVVAQELPAGERCLVAYVVPATQPPPSATTLRRALGQNLPAFMAPAVFVFLDHPLPLTATGKVNRQALPPPGTARPDLDTPFVAPRTVLERQIAAIWADLLALEEVGVDDNFFELGGDSILAMRMLLQAEQQLGCTVSMDFFGQPTVARLARQVVAAAAQVDVNLAGVSAETPMPAHARSTRPPRHSPRSAYDNDALRQQYLFWRGHMPLDLFLTSVKGLLQLESLVLDVGCGDGHVAIALAPFARQVIGIDLSPAMIDLAAHRQAASGAGNVTFLVGNSEHLPSLSGTFDLVISRYSLEHVDVEAVLQCMGQLLRPGGWLLVIEPIAPPHGWPRSLWIRWMALRQAPALARQAGIRAAWQIMRFRLGQAWVHHQLEDACWSLAQWQAVTQRLLPGAVLSRSTTGDSVMLLWQCPGNGDNCHAAEEQSLTSDSDALVREPIDDMQQRDPRATIVAARQPDASSATRSPTPQPAAEPQRRSNKRRSWRARAGARLRRFMNVGPVRAGRAFLPYEVGVRLQRALTVQPTIQRLFDQELDTLRRWQAELGVPHDAQSCRISLLANTWLDWRKCALTKPGVLERWVTMEGEGWHLFEQPDPSRGIVIVLPHVGRMISPLQQMIQLHGRETAKVTNDLAIKFTKDKATSAVRQTQSRTAQLWHAQQVLRRKGVVFIAGDGLQGNQSVAVPFWGRQRPFQIGAAELSIETGALFMPAFVTFDARGRVQVEVMAPLTAQAESKEEQISELTEQYGALYAARWPQFYASIRWHLLAYTLNLPRDE